MTNNKTTQWCVTGVAGFIGSHLAEELLRQGYSVVGVDDLSTGYRENLDHVREEVGQEAARRFTFVEGGICDGELIKKVMSGVSYVLHHAAIASVPLSLEKPALTARVNVEGFCTIARAAINAGVKRMVYASSSAVYGDDETLPKDEKNLGRQLSPYGASKRANELFAEALSDLSDTDFIGLRYFNVVGARQDPQGAYAAVIPQWIDKLVKSESLTINGDPGISRDFVAVQNVVAANIAAALAPSEASGSVYNIGGGGATTLGELFTLLRDLAAERGIESLPDAPVIGPARPGDIIHSVADITRARTAIGFDPAAPLRSSLQAVFDWMSRG